MHALFLRLIKSHMRNDELLLLLKRLKVDISSGKSLGMSHLDRTVLYSSKSAELDVMIETSDYYIKNQAKSCKILTTPFYNTRMPAVLELKKLFAQDKTGSKPSF